MRTGKDGTVSHNKKDMARVMAKGAGITTEQAGEVLESLLTHIVQAVIDRKECVHIPNLLKMEALPVKNRYRKRQDGTYVLSQIRPKLLVKMPGRAAYRMYVAS